MFSAVYTFGVTELHRWAVVKLWSGADHNFHN